MCRVTLAHTHRHRILTTTLFDRVKIKLHTYYYRNRILRLASYVARMPTPLATQAPDELGLKAPLWEPPLW